MIKFVAYFTVCMFCVVSLKILTWSGIRCNQVIRCKLIMGKMVRDKWKTRHCTCHFTSCPQCPAGENVWPAPLQNQLLLYISTAVMRPFVWHRFSSVIFHFIGDVKHRAIFGIQPQLYKSEFGCIPHWNIWTSLLCNAITTLFSSVLDTLY